MISSIFFCALTFFIEAHALIYIYIYIFWGKDFNTTQPPSSTNKIQKKTQCFNNNHNLWELSKGECEPRTEDGAIRQSHRQLYRRLCQSHAVHGGRKKEKTGVPGRGHSKTAAVFKDQVVLFLYSPIGNRFPVSSKGRLGDFVLRLQR